MVINGINGYIAPSFPMYPLSIPPQHMPPAHPLKSQIISRYVPPRTTVRAVAPPEPLTSQTVGYQQRTDGTGRDRQRQTDRQTDRQTETDRQTDRQTLTDR